MEAELRRCTVTFEPRDIPRSGRLVFTTAHGDVVAGLSMAEAVPSLCRTPHDGVHPTVAFYRSATLASLELVSRRRLEPRPRDGSGAVAWRLGGLDDEDLDRITDLEASAPPDVNHVRAYLDAVVDYLASPDLAAGVGLSLRLELIGGLETLDGPGRDGRFRAVVRVHSLAEPEHGVDAAELWSGAAPELTATRADTMLCLRRAAAAWEPLHRLLRQQVPDQLVLDDDELSDLLAGGAQRMAAQGVAVRWPEEIDDGLTVTAVIPSSGPLSRTDDSRSGGNVVDATDLLHASWRIALDGSELTTAEVAELATTSRPFTRLRDRWVLVDPRVVRKAAETEVKPIGALDALGAALTGSAEIDGERVAVAPTGWLATLRDRIADPEASREKVDVPAGLVATLRDYQLRGLRWLHKMTSLRLGACLADDMGLGKTITVIALHLLRQSNPATAGRTLVVCPASLLGNWEREIARFAPGTPVRRFHGADRELDAVLADTPGGFVITTYATMRVDTEAVEAPLATTAWGMLVADEAQHIKNAQSKTARAMRTIPAEARIALTGTPIENDLSELWAILDWTTPGLLGSLSAFRSRWADPIEAGREPRSTEAARDLARLVGPFLLRRRKSDPGVAPELPAKTETDRPVPLTTEQARLYRTVVDETLAKVRSSSGMARRGLVLALFTALKQICNHPAQYLKQPLGEPGRSGKLELLDELVTTIVAEDEATLVFTQYVTMARLIEEHLMQRGVPVQLLHGGTPVAQREHMVRRFQEGQPGSVPVFVLSLKAAGTGLNLTRAGHVIHYDRWWNPAVEEQATDRAHRIGQTRPVQVHRLIAEGTVEDRIAAMLSAKRDLADAVLTSGEAALTELSDGELAELVELRSPRG